MVFYFLSILVVSWLLCVFMTCVFGLLFALYFLWMGSIHAILLCKVFLLNQRAPSSQWPLKLNHPTPNNIYVFFLTKTLNNITISSNPIKKFDLTKCVMFPMNLKVKDFTCSWVDPSLETSHYCFNITQQQN